MQLKIKDIFPHYKKLTDYSPRHSILELRKMLAEVDFPQLKHFEIQ